MDEAKIARVENAVKALSALTAGNSGNQSHVTINAGGIGVLISSVCCAVMFTALVIGGLVASVAFRELKDEFREIREEQRVTKAYLQSIWQQAPYLKSEEHTDE